MCAHEVITTLNVFDYTAEKFMIEVSAGDSHVNFSNFIETAVQPSSWKIRFRDEVVLKNLSKLLQLTYIAQQAEGRVCFAESTELRPEFRDFFTTQDLKYFLIGSIQYELNKKNNPTQNLNALLFISYPKSSDIFWKNVAIGESLID